MYTTPAVMLLRKANQIRNVLGVAAGVDLTSNEKLLAAIAAANATVDGYLEKRYTLPLQSVPPELEQHATNIAMYNLLQDRQDALSEADRVIYKDAITYLQDVAKGNASLRVSVPAANVDMPVSAEITGSIPSWMEIL